MERLGRHPRGGRVGRVGGTREQVVGGTPYAVVYRLEEEAILVLRVLHGRQQWPSEPDPTEPDENRP